MPMWMAARFLMTEALWRSTVLAWLLMAAAPPAAHAAATDLEIRRPAEPLSCLSSVAGAAGGPAYPSAVSPMVNAVVRVQLVFASADQPPEASVFYNNGGDAFAEVVRQHVARYRLPCLPSGHTFNAAQEFQFIGNGDRRLVFHSEARDSEPLTLTPECLLGLTNAELPKMPEGNIIFGTPASGNVLLEMTFDGPAAPPRVVVVYDGGNRRLAAAATASALTYRLPCMKPGDPRLHAVRQFNFRWDRDEVIGLKPQLTLVELLGVVKGLKQQTVRFDLATMACPFDVKFAPRQPYAENYVSQIGAQDPNRREFIEWLRAITLELPAPMMRTAFGETSTVSVPCALLDLS